MGNNDVLILQRGKIKAWRSYLHPVRCQQSRSLNPGVTSSKPELFWAITQLPHNRTRGLTACLSRRPLCSSWALGKGLCRASCLSAFLVECRTGPQPDYFHSHCLPSYLQSGLQRLAPFIPAPMLLLFNSFYHWSYLSVSKKKKIKVFYSWQGLCDEIFQDLQCTLIKSGVGFNAESQGPFQDFQNHPKVLWCVLNSKLERTTW